MIVLNDDDHHMNERTKKEIIKPNIARSYQTQKINKYRETHTEAMLLLSSNHSIQFNNLSNH